MTFVRTFVAVLLADELKSRISEVQEQAKKLAPDVKWVEPENFHITLKFLGNVREDALAGVLSAVEDAVKDYQKFEVSVAGVGAFPNPKNARVVWVGVESGQERLASLAATIDAKLAELGFPREERDFKSHITIGRVKSKKHLGALARGIAKIEARSLGTQEVRSVAVMQSVLRPEGPVYSPLRVIELS
ncbi:MAG: RNA 2',3'-cyclic phosphodiesterase [Armatimonadota bacterium]|nr:RNA 2',3'-cyclic phosphodiesterase [Armatimonadota bacterium]